MERILNVCHKSYKGTTTPEALNFNQLGLEQHGIKIVPYITEREERKSFEESNFKKWLNSLEETGTCIPLWKGKYKVTICQKDYANMKVVGALFIPNKSILSLYKATRINRDVRLKAQSMLKDILTVPSSSTEPSLLMLLNNTRWTVEIVDYMGRPVFKKAKLSENKASDTLNLELNKIKLRWETLNNAKK